MDPLALITLRSTCRSASQCAAFVVLFLSCFPGDPDGLIKKVFDVLKARNKSLLHPYDLQFAFGAKRNNDDFETVAAMAAVVLSQKIRGNFMYVRD